MNLPPAPPHLRIRSAQKMIVVMGRQGGREAGIRYDIRASRYSMRMHIHMHMQDGDVDGDDVDGET